MQNKRFISLAVFAIGMAAASLSFAGNSNGCQGNCAGGDTTNQGGNGYGGAGVGIGVGLGGNGGQGGAGGAVVGSGNSTATGGSVLGSGNSSVRTDVTTAQGQQQGQGQSQTAKGGNASQGQAQSSRNDNRSSAAGNTTATEVNVSGDTVSYNAARIPVATAYAPNISPTALCMGSTSAGIQTGSLGVSLGSSWTDANCVQLEQVRTAAAVLGDRETAAEMMCSVSDAYREARDRTGKPCGVATSVKMGAGVEGVIPVAVAQHKPEETDPIKRFRLGLPPLAR